MKHRTHKHKHKNNDNKRLVKATRNIINDNAIKLSSDRIINNPTLENIAMFNTLLQSKLQQQLDQHKSFSPSLNRQLESIQTRRQNKNLFGCGLERHLDKTVIGIFLTSVVAKINLSFSGGSSSVFNKPLNACLESI